jgi:hypothetical protein
MLKPLPLLILGGLGLAVYALTRPSSAAAQTTTPTSTAPRTTTNPNLAGLRIPAGLTLSTADVDTLRALLKTDATGALQDIYGSDDASTRLRFTQVIVDRMGQDHKPAYETVETVLREFYA